ncbi:phage tail fiber protein [Morganella morganii]|uniref:phage tail fiber protein n=1 Tax=Morganella morganii TaxID=582 RepID=UPI00406B9C0B
MIYTDGTIAIKAGSPIVTGTGTQWKKNIHGVAPGQLISIENGAAPVSMMIRAVNSDTELVLSFNAPVTLSGAKYSIATMVPDTISDAARTMSANQGYIVYFLQAMQQWMTDTGQVEIELPNGQKVTLDSVKALNEAISKIPKVVQDTGNSKTDVISQDGTVKAINAAKPGDATTTAKGIIQLSAAVGASTDKVPHEKAIKDFVNGMIYNPNDRVTRVINPNGTQTLQIEDGGTIGFKNITKDAYTFALTPEGDANFYTSTIKVYGNNDWPGFSLIRTDKSHIRLEANPSSSTVLFNIVNRNTQGANTNGVSIPNTNGTVAVIGGNTAFDGSGYLKRSSPIIQIYPDGNYDTNDESEGAEVSRTGTGQYHITGILGYNSDGAWGVNGGISVPKDNNGLELVYVYDRVQSDGSLIIETCHRQHAHLPERFQNWRLKDITPEGERIFYQDGEPCDLPESTRLDVRVEMPQGSVWNVKQRELAEQMEREQAEREAQEAAEQAGDSEE